MKPTVALLRAVNVGGTGKLPMAELKAMCEACGFEAVRTYIASGNVVFRTGLTEAKVKAVLEAKLASYAGRPVGLMVRGKKELEQILAANPFPDAPPNRTLVTFLDKRPPANAAEQATNVKNEEIQVGRREIYVHYGDGMGSSRLKVPAAKDGTARNINTVRKLVSLLAALSLLFVLGSCTASGPSHGRVRVRCRLVVEVQGGDGLPTGSELAAPEANNFTSGLPSVWPDHPFVIVMPAEAGPTGPIVADRSGIAPLRGVAAGPGRIAFPIRRNQSYLVAVIGRGAGGQLFPGDPELVRIGPDEERVLLVVRPGKRDLAMGEVEVTLGGDTPRNLDHGRREVEEEFIPVEGVSWGGAPDTVEDPGTGMTLLTARIRWGWSEERGVVHLPEGRYRVATRLMPFQWTSLTSLHGEDERVVDVIAGKRCQVALEAGPLSRIRLTFQPGEGLNGGAATLWLRNARGERRPLTRVVERRFPDMRMSSEWPKAIRCVSGWFPTGTYELVAQMDGGPMIFIQTVALEPWETLEVEWPIIG